MFLLQCSVNSVGRRNDTQVHTSLEGSASISQALSRCIEGNTAGSLQLIGFLSGVSTALSLSFTSPAPMPTGKLTGLSCSSLSTQGHINCAKESVLLFPFLPFRIPSSSAL